MPRSSATDTLDASDTQARLGDLDEQGLERLPEFSDSPTHAHETQLRDLDARDDRLSQKVEQTGASPTKTQTRGRSVPMDARETLQALARGRLFDELTEAMMAVAEDVINTGRKGKVTLNLTIRQATPGEPSVIVVEEIKRTPPKKDPLGAILFIGDREFHRRDPRPDELDFRVLEPTSNKVVEVDCNSTVVSVKDAS